ncbi:MAG: VCBS repeat-containing protein [Bacteroidota bacterium]
MRNLILLLLVLALFGACHKKEATLFKQLTTEESGITFVNTIVETDSSNILNNEYIFNGGGVAVGDFNNDGKPDLFFTGNQVPNKLFLNQGQLKFEDISFTAGIEASDKWSTGMALADINADGWLDIYVCAAMLPGETQRANMLFIHQGLNDKGIPRFIEMAEKFGLAETGNSMGATFFDYNKDGLLDLYVLNNEQIHTLPTNYRPRIKDGTAVSNDRLYRNNGDNTFTDVTIEAGITIEGFGLGIAVADLNYDGWPDLHISNDYLTNDLLYVNNQDGTFSNNIENMLKHQSKFSMGSDVADYNNDGYLDIITLDMLPETNYRMKTTIGNNNYINYVFNERWGYEYQYSRNMLHQGNGPGVPFSEIGLMAGVARTDWSWSPLFADVDNDGLKDLLITNGFPRDITDKDFGDYNLSVSQFLSPEKILDSIPVVKIPNYAFKNNADGTFTDAGKLWGLDIPSFSNGAAIVDLDKDGDLDYVVNNINDEAFVFENTLTQSNPENSQFLKVILQGTTSNPMGVGAKIVLRMGDDNFQYYEHYLTRGYMSSVDRSVHFGLGDRREINSIEILWPDGSYQKILNVKSNQTLLLKYHNATETSLSELLFPLIPKKTDPIFEEISGELGINFTHSEKDIIDYNIQRILPHKLTQNGPCVEVGDLNQDGLEDFILGSSVSHSPTIFFQQADGSFIPRPLLLEEDHKQYEEEGIALFDLENDGDLDLYLVSGSNEFKRNSDRLTDRLMINDGKGNFTFAPDRHPQIRASGSVVKAYDFDQDGFTDLFVGGRTPIGQYPYKEKSFLLKNDGGMLVDVTEEIAPDLKEIGMVTDVVWADINSDSMADLVVVGELMPVCLFKNNGTSFEKLKTTGLDSISGWWESVLAQDFDKDGDLDFVLGNMGANNFYQPSKDRPVTLLAKDFDNNGSVDPVMFAHFKKDRESYESFPVHFWGDLFAQSPLFRSKFTLYAEYARATRHDLFTADELEGVKTLTGGFDRSSYLENLGNGTFKVHSLPFEAQLAPINDLVTTDFNEDGNPDLLLIGNDYGNETFIGRYDAFNGLLLQGNGKGQFEAIKPDESGFLVSEDAKAMGVVKSVVDGKPLYIITQNKSRLLVFRRSKNHTPSGNYSD